MDVGRIHPADNDPRAPLLSRRYSEPVSLPAGAFNLRLPHELMAMIRQSAADNRRSINNELIIRLARSFEGWRQ